MRRTMGWILTLLFLLSACERETPFAVEDALTLLDAGLFTGDMAPVDPEIVPALYGLDRSDVRECVCYMAANTAASSDQVMVLVLKDLDAAQAAEAACKKRVASLLEEVRRYTPTAVPRLEAAVIRQGGATVLLAVGDPARLSAAVDELHRK